MIRWVLVALLGALAGAAAVWAFDRQSQANIESTIHNYLLEHPEIIPLAIQKLQEREAGGAVAENHAAIVTPFDGAWAGDAMPEVSVVEYFDYNCGYCRSSQPVVAALLKSDPKIRIVYRDLPILAPSSKTAARVSLAAAAQGKFQVFHDALFASGQVSDATIAAAAQKAGVDLGKAAAFVPQADAEIARNLEMASKLNLTGTPSWVIGNRVLSGALSLDMMKQAVANAKEAG